MVSLIAVLMFYYAKIQAGDTSPQMLRDYAVVESLVAGKDPQVVLGVIDHEDVTWNPTAIHKNDMAIGCNSVGLVQIRDCNHPDVSYAQAINPIFAVNFLVKNIDKCKTWWKATCPIPSG